ncbi:MAG: peptidyl-prolyl cis-trans isomerase [Victivallales bacterium]|nr:peptidyl-prolyl cis-trans isomerase [Victivallales bacterium]
MKYRIATISFVLALFALAQSYTDAVRAIVGDTVITDFDLPQSVAAAVAMLPPSLSPEQRKAEIEHLQERALDNAVDQELIYLEFQDLKGTVPMSQIQEELNRFVTEQAGGSEERFREMLHRENITFQEFQERIRKHLAVEWLRADRCRRGVIVTEAQIREYFETHRADFDAPVSNHVQVIQLRNDGKYAENLDDTIALIRQKLRNGISFEKLAEEYSEGGAADLGWQTSLAPALQKIVNLLRPGEIYWQSLSLGDSTYLVRLVDRKGGPATTLTHERHDEIEQLLYAKAVEANYKKYIERLYMKFPVRRF